MDLKQTIIAKKNLSESRFQKLYPDLYMELLDKTYFLLSDASFSERKKAIIFNAKECPKCQICGKLMHFDVNEYGIIRFCSKKCRYMNHSMERKQYFQNMPINEKKAWIANQEQKRYEKTGYRTNFENPEIKAKVKDTLQTKYGVNNPYKIDSVIQHNKEIWQQKKAQTIEKFKKSYNSLDKNVINEKKRETSIKKYGVENYSKTEFFKNKYESKEFIKQITDKSYNTKKKHNSFNTSKPEQIIYDLLKLKFHDVKTQYKSIEYPFSCDFYIPILNLYIEYQGTWTHGGKPYTNTNEDNIILEKWKAKNTDYYNNAIYVWSIHDCNKRKTAKKNQLNWIEFFNMNQFYEWYNKL